MQVADLILPVFAVIVTGWLVTSNGCAVLISLPSNPISFHKANASGKPVPRPSGSRYHQ